MKQLNKVLKFSMQGDPEKLALLSGLILSGGQSSRMGTDKWALNFHGRNQIDHSFDLLSSLCGKVFVSCRLEQQAVFQSYPTIPDQLRSEGPLVGIISAMNYDPGAAWLVISCDMPLLQKNTLAKLVDSRDPHFHATAFRSPSDGSPEPLCAIYEPLVLPLLQERFDRGERSPRRILQIVQTKLIAVEQLSELSNVNTPEECERVRQQIGRTDTF